MKIYLHNIHVNVLLNTYYDRAKPSIMQCYLPLLTLPVADILYFFFCKQWYNHNNHIAYRHSRPWFRTFVKHWYWYIWQAASTLQQLKKHILTKMLINWSILAFEVGLPEYASVVFRGIKFTWHTKPWISFPSWWAASGVSVSFSIRAHSKLILLFVLQI
jgi:hypothetical protein